MSKTEITLEEVVMIFMHKQTGVVIDKCRKKTVWTLLHHFNAPTKLYDRVVDIYIGEIDAQRTSLASPVFELSECETFCAHASIAKVEEVLERAVQHGILPLSQRLAELIDRTLSADEILTLTKHYADGAAPSDRDEERLIEAARAVGDDELDQRVQGIINEKHERWRNAID